MSGLIFKDLVVTGVGLESCLGMDALQVAVAVKANIQRLVQHPRYVWIGSPIDRPKEDIPGIRVSPVPSLDEFEDGQERVTKLGVMAMKKLIENESFTPDLCPNAGLFMALPEGDEVINSWSFDDSFVKDVTEQAGFPDFKITKFNQFGSTGVFHALGEAARCLGQGLVDICIVGGVDSFLLEERLEWLDKTWRLNSQRNVDGFMPGESAVMLVIETVESAQSRGATILAKLDAAGFGIEANTLHSNKVSLGQGLTEAISGVLEAKQAPADYSFEYVYCDLNGESYAAGEWGMVLSRLGDNFNKIKKLTHHASNCGELGAASGAFMIASVAALLHKDLQGSDEALLWSSADNGQRMAVTLRKFNS